MELQFFSVRRRTSLAVSAFALLVFLAQSVGAGEREDIAIVLDKYIKALYAARFSLRIRANFQRRPTSKGCA
jgi:hypothetical protein